MKKKRLGLNELKMDFSVEPELAGFFFYILYRSMKVMLSLSVFVIARCVSNAQDNAPVGHPVARQLISAIVYWCGHPTATQGQTSLLWVQ